MKAKELPKKIYIPRLEGSDILVRDWSETKFRRYFSIDIAENVEYVRADTFIEKACEWFRTLDDKEPPYNNTEEFIEGFKKAIEL